MSRSWTTNNNYKTVGLWSWDSVLLKSKIVPGATEDSCTQWLGSMSPTGALFGARKQGLQQMTQARRLAWMEETGKDASPYRFGMLCRNQSCLNTRHFELLPNNRKPKEQQ